MGNICCRDPLHQSINIYSSMKKDSYRSPTDLKIFKFPKITFQDYEDVQNKIKEMTGFNPYYPMNIKLNQNQKRIDGTYFQYNKGCIIYALINNGWINEDLIPDSMKYYKNHNHKEDERNDRDLLRRCMSIIDLSQLWINIGGNCPYLEINLIEVQKRIFLILKEYFTNPNTEIMKKVAEMTWQNKDYYELIGNINIKFTPLIEIPELNNNPTIKNGIDSGIIKKRDIIKFGRHCFIFDEIFEEDSKKVYSFQDSLAYFFSPKNLNYNNCECNKKKGYVFAREDTRLINLENSNEIEIGILSVIK